MYEATFRIHHDSIYVERTAGTGTEIQLWCGNHCDLLYVSTVDGDQPVTDLVDGIEAEVGVQDKLVDDHEVVLVTENCLRREQDELIEEYLYPHDCIYLPPLNYLDGQMVVRVVALTQDNLTNFFRQVNEDFDVDVESKHELKSYELNHVQQSIPLLIAEDALPKLSDRQHEVLTTAYEQGYYDVPRETDMANVAEDIGIERRTTGEHLVRAEKKVMKSYMEHFLHA